jgi:hypothetical protein
LSPGESFDAQSVVRFAPRLAIALLSASQRTKCCRDRLKYKTETDILYRDGGDLDEYSQRRCRLDVFSPTKDSGKPFPTIVWLAAHDIDANKIAGLVPFSGHTITHFTVRAERGIDGKRPIVDDMAPLFHVRPDAPPMLFITGDRNLEMLGRYF